MKFYDRKNELELIKKANRVAVVGKSFWRLSLFFFYRKKAFKNVKRIKFV